MSDPSALPDKTDSARVSWRGALTGLRLVLPLLPGISVFGAVFGAGASHAGLTLGEAILSSGLVFAGEMTGDLNAFDAKTGEILWRYDVKLPDDLRLCCGPGNRGVAIGGEVSPVIRRIVVAHRSR